MDYFEAQELFNNMYPDKKITYEFDEKCQRFHELVYTDGIPNPVHHIENNKVKVSVEEMDPMYIPIAPHRECCTWSHIKALINSMKDPS